MEYFLSRTEFALRVRRAPFYNVELVGGWGGYVTEG